MTSTTLEAHRRFVASCSFRPVKGVPEGPLQKPPEPHAYVIRAWDNVDSAGFDAFRQTINRHGYKGRYTAPYNNRTMTCQYLVLDDYVYWFIPPQMLNRTLVENRQHDPIEEPVALEVQLEAQLELGG